PTDIYTLSLHDALPICTVTLEARRHRAAPHHRTRAADTRRSLDIEIYLPRWIHPSARRNCTDHGRSQARANGHRKSSPALRKNADRKSTRLNSSHDQIS